MSMVFITRVIGFSPFLILLVTQLQTHCMNGPVLTKQDSELLQAAYDGNIDKAETAMKEGGRIDMRQESTGIQPIHFAVDQGHRAMVNWLLDQGADINSVTPNGMAPLQFVREGDRDIQKMLLSRGANANAADSLGGTALHNAAEEGDSQLLQLLYQYGGNLNSPDKRGITPLMRALQHRKLDAARWLVEHGSVLHGKEEELATLRELFNQQPLEQAIIFDTQDKAAALLGNYSTEELSAKGIQELNQALIIAAALLDRSELVDFILKHFGNALEDASLREGLLRVKYIFMAIRGKLRGPGEEEVQYQERNKQLKEALEQAVYSASVHRELSIVRFLLERSFPMGLTLDLDPVVKHIDLLLTGGMTEQERHEYVQVVRMLKNTLAMNIYPTAIAEQSYLQLVPNEMVSRIMVFIMLQGVYQARK